METEAKAKVVASVWGATPAKLIQFLALVVLRWLKTASAARNLINFAPQTDATTFAFASVSILLLWHPEIKEIYII